MKMARPSARDIDAAGELMQLLGCLDERWSGPWPHPDAGEDLPALLRGDQFDDGDRLHLRTLYNHLARLLRTAPNFYGRVIGGMCYVICWDQNKILDPADRCLELHPDLRAGLELLHAQRADFLPRLEREARAALASFIHQSTAGHLAAMSASWAPSLEPIHESLPTPS